MNQFFQSASDWKNGWRLVLHMRFSVRREVSKKRSLGRDYPGMVKTRNILDRTLVDGLS
jgi:hypothetical protein